MKLIKTEIDIPPEDPFKNDMFTRKSFAEGITNLITDIDHPMTLAVDAAWGEGKTTFAKMWEQHLKNEGIPIIYFDAFKKDSSSDAFMSLAAEFIKLAKDKTSEESSLVEKLTKSTLSIAKAALPVIAKSAVKLGTLGVIDGEELTEEITKEIAGVTSQLVEEKLEEFLKDDEIRENFRTALESLVEAYNIADEENYASGITKPLVIIIDELDRCRPPFALSILEAIKHYFDVPNVVFVFMLNGKQLEHSIVQEYGGDIKSAKIYLEKFFYLRLILPFKIDHHDEQADRANYANHVLNELRFVELFETDNEIYRRALEVVLNSLERLSLRRNLSLRTIERICTDIYLVYRVLKIPPRYTGPAIPMLCAMRVLQPELYERARVKLLTISQAMSFYEYDISIDLDAYRSSSEKWEIGFLRFFLDENQEITENFSEYLHKVSFHLDIDDRLELIPYFCKNYVDVFTKS